MAPTTYIAIAVCFGGFFGGLVYLAVQMRRATADWKEFAERHELSYSDGPALAGTYRGRDIRAYTDVRNTDTQASGNPKGYTVFRAELPTAFPIEFSARPAGWFVSVKEALGLHGAEVGVSDLDEAFEFESRDPAALRGAFESEAFEEAFRRVAESLSKGVVRFNEDAVQLEDRGMLPRGERLGEALDAVTTFADRLQEAAERGALPSDDSKRLDAPNWSSPDETV